MNYRPEHPKPQWMRPHWQSLNGEWAFAMDPAVSGIDREWFKPEAVFPDTICVPFCMESNLSGIGHKDFVNCVWYKRLIHIPANALQGRILLHFGAVDHTATVYINGKECGRHTGGYVSFSVDITNAVHEGDNTLTVRAYDDTRSPMVPSGKQSAVYHSWGCYYTRTTGIWQSVWLEFLPAVHIRQAHIVPSLEAGTVTVHAELCGKATLTAEAFWDGRPVGNASCACDGGTVCLTVPLKEVHAWEVGKGGLYDLTFTYGEDTVHSYTGLRSLQFDSTVFRINGKPVFQRLILDQGFYPDGIYTAPSDEALVADIERSMAMGFNGARLHEKIFEERYLYHCDRLGYIVWGEYPAWGLNHADPACVYGMLPEWTQMLYRDRNHPAIVAWCAFNETWDQADHPQCDAAIELMYRTAKAIDPTRPCIDASGNFHVVTDIYDLHDYEQDPDVFASHYTELGRSNVFTHHFAFSERQQYDGTSPFFVSEYGGIRWSDEQSAWGYGDAPADRDAFLERFRRLTDILLDHPHIGGFCYTQLTDVEQEQNGLYTYDRHAKFDPALIRAIVSRKAAIEQD